MTADRDKAPQGGKPVDDNDATLRMQRPQSGVLPPQEEATEDGFDPERTLVQEDRTLAQDTWDTDTVVLEPLHKKTPPG